MSKLLFFWIFMKLINDSLDLLGKLLIFQWISFIYIIWQAKDLKGLVIFLLDDQVAYLNIVKLQGCFKSIWTNDFHESVKQYTTTLLAHLLKQCKICFNITLFLKVSLVRNPVIMQIARGCISCTGFQESPFVFSAFNCQVILMIFFAVIYRSRWKGS